jgi:hypothetical protein
MIAKARQIAGAAAIIPETTIRERKIRCSALCHR